MWSLKSGRKEGMQPETDSKCVICLRLSQSIKQCVSVSVCVCCVILWNTLGEAD